MKEHSLADQFRHTFFLIIVSSIVATLLTYVLIIGVFSLAKDIYPADYYERQIPTIEEYVYRDNIALLSQSSENRLRDIIQGDGLLYLVVDDNGNTLYGTSLMKPFESKEELFTDLVGQTVFRNGYYIYTVPIIDEIGEAQGAILLFYQIKVTFANNTGRLIFFIMILIALLSPFLYIVSFTLIFSRILAKKVNRPLQLLTDAAKKIKEKNLDFEINYHSENELGSLCTAFSEMKDELRKSLSVQWEMEQERVEMIESLAHDLKSPLSIIMGYTDSLIDSNRNDNGKLYRYLSVIKKNAEKSTALVQQMQYTTDLEKSNVQLNLESVNLYEFLNQKVHDYELEASKKHIEFLLKIERDVPINVEIEKERIMRILDNIISNSLQYTPNNGTISITVTAEKNMIFYKICDSGCGFSSKDLKKAFDKFYRGDEARQTKGGHSGLGLYIVKKLLGQINGSIQIENTELGGACVIFSHGIR